MKNFFRYLSLVIIMIFAVYLFIYKDKISVFASEKNISDVKIGEVFKVGDILPFNSSVNLCMYNSEISSCDTKYNVINIVYNDLHSCDTPSYEYNILFDSNGVPLTKIEIKEDDISEYWRLYSVYEMKNVTTPYLQFVFTPYEYIEPKFDLICDPAKVKLGESAICSLNLTYYNNLESIDFGLNVGDFNISNIKINEQFENVNEAEGMYSLKTLGDLVESEDGTEISLLTFEVNSDNDEDIDLQDNIKVVNLGYSDVYNGSSSVNINDISSTVKYDAPTPMDDIIEENPKTGVFDYISFIMVGLIISFIGYVSISYNNQKFEL